MDDEKCDKNAHEEEDQHRVLHELDVLAVIARSRVMAVIVRTEVVEALEKVAAWTKAWNKNNYLKYNDNTTTIWNTMTITWNTLSR